jgi:hypothetical protein
MALKLRAYTRPPEGISDTRVGNIFSIINTEGPVSSCDKTGKVYSLEYTSMFFTTYHVGHCCEVNIAPHVIFALLWPEVIVATGVILAWILPRSLCNNVFQQWPLFPLLPNSVFQQFTKFPIVAQQWSPVMQVAYPIGKSHRQTGRHRLAHNVFFAHAKAWSTPTYPADRGHVWRLVIWFHVLFSFCNSLHS